LPLDSTRAFFKHWQVSDVQAATSGPSTVSAPKNFANNFVNPRGSDILPLPSSAAEKQLTRSQIIFSISTQINPLSLLIQGDTEFFLFMDMRSEFQWASFSMTSRKWVVATETYNHRLEELCRAKGVVAIKKNPRALMDKLGHIEPKIANRLATGNFICK
jgi:hypothetical protein